MPLSFIKRTVILLGLGVFSFSCFFSLAAPLKLVDASCADFLIANGWLRIGANRAMPAGPFKGRPLAIATPAPALKILTNEEFVRLFPDVNMEGKWAVANFISRHGPSIA